MIAKDNRDLPVQEITPENYRVPSGEENYYHVKMEIGSFDQHTGARLSHPFIQKFSRVDFEGGMMSVLRQQGYDMEILHDPKEWQAAHAAEIEKTREKKAAEAQAKAKAEAEALKKALREELRAELLAEMKGKKTKGKASEKPEESEEPDLS